MALKLVVDSLDDVAESFKSSYKKGEDGKFHLDVDGIEDTSGLKSALQKERDSVKELKSSIKTLEEKIAIYKDIDDPEKAKDALKKIQAIEEKKLIEAGELEKVLENRTAMMKKDHETQVAQLTKRAEEAETNANNYKTQLATAVIERGISDAISEVGQPRKGAMVDILQRGRTTWKLGDDGKPVALNADGSAIFGKDGKAAITMKEWAEGLLTEAPFLFEESKGGGARGSLIGGDGRKLSPEEYEKLSPAQKIAFARQSQQRR